MGAILAYFGSKMHLLLMGADLNAQFKIVYADGSKMTDKADTNQSDLQNAGENDVNNDLKVSGGILAPILTPISHNATNQSKSFIPH